MPFMPFQILGLWLRGLLALAILGLAGWLLKDWNDRRDREVREVVARPADVDRDRDRAPGDREMVVRRVQWHFGANRETAELIGGLALLALALGGGRWLGGIGLAGGDDPKPERTGRVETLHRPDGAEIHAELYGPDDAPPIVLTHGWGVDSEEWYYAKTALAGRFRVIAWDLRGLGRSKGPRSDDYSLEAMAGDLDAVLDLARGRPAVAVGHSIGGMILQTYARLNPERAASRLAGAVFVHTTYTNPVETTRNAGFYKAIQKPVLEPLLHLTIWLAPVVWAMNALSYLNGSAHSSARKDSFDGRATRGQVDFLARYTVKCWPGVLAKGMLAMLRFEGRPGLATLAVPALVVAGDRDPVTLPMASAVIAESAPRASLTSLEPAKHQGHMERHDPFTSALADFAASCSAAPAAP